MPEQLPMDFMLADALREEGIVLELRDGMWVVDWGANCIAIFTSEYPSSVRAAYDMYIMRQRPLSETEKRLIEWRERER